MVLIWIGAEEEEGEAEEEEEEKKPKTEKKTVWDWDLLNNNKPIWLRQPSEVTEEEYNKFFKALAKVRPSCTPGPSGQSSLPLKMG